MSENLLKLDYNKSNIKVNENDFNNLIEVLQGNIENAVNRLTESRLVHKKQTENFIKNWDLTHHPSNKEKTEFEIVKEDKANNTTTKIKISYERTEL